MPDYFLREEAYLHDESGDELLDELGQPILAEGTWRYEKEEQDGFWLLEEQDNVPTPGQGIAGGNSPGAAAGATPGGAVTGGGSPGASVVVTPGGAIAGGQTIYEAEGPPGLARISQAPVEVVYEPTDAKLRSTQAPVEVVVEPTDAKARVSSIVIEVVYRNVNEVVDAFLVVDMPEPDA